MIPLANRRTLTKTELCLAALVLLLVGILPKVHLYWLGSSSELTVHETTGPISFAGSNKHGYAILMDGKRYTCAHTPFDRHDCTYYPVVGKKGSGRIQDHRDRLTGRTATIRWAEVPVLPWGKLRVIIEMHIDGQRYRKPLDYDTELAYAKQSLRWTFVLPGLLMMFLIWLRLKSKAVVQ